MGFLVTAHKIKEESPSTLITYHYEMDGRVSWPKDSGKFTVNLLTGQIRLVKKAERDNSCYGYIRIQLKIKRLLELEGKYPDHVVWAS